MKSCKLRIAIDGGAATGKSSISQMIAEKLNIPVLNTGMLYRLVTLYAIRNNLVKNQDKLIKHLDNIKINFQSSNLSANFDFTLDELNSQQVSDSVSKVSEISEVRKFLFNLQRKVAISPGIVVEGRDIGTKIMPDADFKFFLTVSPEIAAKRRQEQLNINGVVNFEKIKENIESRNNIDSNRKSSPFKMANDAIIIDTTFLTKDEVFKKIYQILINKKDEK